MQNFLYLSYHAYFILPHNSENVLQKEMKDWTFKVYLLTGEVSSWFPLIEPLKMTLWHIYVWFLNLLSNREASDCFSRPNILPKLSKTTIACPK